MDFFQANKAYFFRTERNILDDRFNRTIKHCSWDFPGEGLNGEGEFIARIIGNSLLKSYFFCFILLE